MKKLLFIFCFILTALTLTACSADEPTTADNEPAEENTQEETISETESESEVTEESIEVTIAHELGETTVKTNPEKVVVFDFGFLDILDQVGLGENVIGLPKSSNVPDYLSEYNSDTYANVGSLVEADFEKLYELQPDVILISARMSSSYDSLSEIAPTVYLPMPSATYMDTLAENLNTFATIFTDYSDKFTSELATIQTNAEEIRNTVEESESTGLIIMTNDSSISVFGFGSRFALIYEDLGFILTDESIEESTHGQSASFEYISEQNPDYLFVVDRSAAVGTGEETGAQELLDNELINNMNAAKNDHIVYLNAINWYTVSGGINSTSMMLEEIKNALE